jgi:hypothetical protein
MPKSYRSRIAAELGRVGGLVGGKSRSKKKVEAVRKNVAKARAVRARQRKEGSQ